MYSSPLYQILMKVHFSEKHIKTHYTPSNSETIRVNPVTFSKHCADNIWQVYRLVSLTSESRKLQISAKCMGIFGGKQKENLTCAVGMQ